jgi:hypothetical protein
MDPSSDFVFIHIATNLHVLEKNGHQNLGQNRAIVERLTQKRISLRIFRSETRIPGCQKMNDVNVLDHMLAFGNDAAQNARWRRAWSERFLKVLVQCQSEVTGESELR